MTRWMRYLTIFVALAASGTFEIFNTPVKAADVLLNGGLEQGAGPDHWTLTQLTAPTLAAGDFNGDGAVNAADYVAWRKNDNTPAGYTNFRSTFGSSGTAGLPVSATEQLDAAQEGFPDIVGLGLLVKDSAGNAPGGPYDGQNKAVNVTLSQTVNFGPSAANRTWTFAGDSLFQPYYSGNLTTLLADSPSGAIPSPTTTRFQLDFLNAGGQVLGSSSLDLPRNRTDTPPVWVPSSLAAVSPANTTQLRVSVLANNMVQPCTTCDQGHDLLLDNFSLMTTGSALNWLVNGNLNLPGAPTNWTLATVGNDVAAFSHDSYAIHTGQTGFWLRSFQGNNPGSGNSGPVDATISQTVAATAGGQYTFSSWAKFQPAYSGLFTDSGTQSFLKMEFLDGGGTLIGSPVTYDLGPNGPLGPNFWQAGDDNQGVWAQVFMPQTTAPGGTASIRVTAGATGMIKEPFSPPQSAMFDDLALILAGSGTGNLLSGDLAANAVPEPAACSILVLAIAACLGIRKRRN